MAKGSVDYLVKLLGDSSKLQAEMGKAADSAEAAGKRMQATGGQLTKNMTLPLVALGGAALKMSMDFDDSMSKIEGLVGVAADEVAVMRDGVLDLAGETAKAPGELADALFTVTSAGQRGAEAMATLELAAKASTAGMGETRDIAEALTASMNAYGPEVLSAAKATDILVGTARAGNFETSQFAGALGQVLPIASSLNIGLEEVGGAVALLTRSNNDAAMSITQVRAVMNALLAPTEQAKTVLSGAGISMEEVRDAASGPGGLVAGLQLLEEATGGNREELARILGSTEAVSAAFSILDADAATIEGTFGAVADSTGALDEAFETAASTGGFQMRQALVELQTTMIEVGEVLLPIAAGVAGAVGDIASAFAELPTPVQNAAIALGGVAIAAGPALTAVGKLVGTKQGEGIKGLVDSVRLFGMVHPAATAGLVGLAAAAGGAALVLKGMADDAKAEQEKMELLEQAMSDAGDESILLSGDLSGLAESLQDLAPPTDEAKGAIEDLSESWVGSFLADQGMLGTIQDLGFEMENLADLTATGTDEFNMFGDGAKRLTADLVDTGRPAEFLVEKFRDIAASSPDDEVVDLVSTLADLVEAEKLTWEEAIRIAGTFDDLADAGDDLREKQEQVSEEFFRSGEAMDLFGDKLGADYVNALADAGAATGDYTTQHETLIDRAEALARAQEDAAGWAASFGGAVGEAGDAIEEVAEASEDAGESMAEYRDRLDDATTEASDLLSALQELNEELAEQVDAADDAFRANKDYRDSLADAESAIGEMTDVLGDSEASVRDQEAAVDDAAAAILDFAADAAEAALANGEIGDSAQESARVQADAVRSMVSGLAPDSPLRILLEETLAEFDAIASTKAEAEILVEDNASLTIEDAQRLLAAFDGDVARATIYIDEVTRATGGGRHVPAAGLGNAMGNVIDRPMLSMVGEDAPMWPEYIIPTNPVHRPRALGLLGGAIEDLLPHFAAGVGTTDRGRMAAEISRKNAGVMVYGASVGQLVPGQHGGSVFSIKPGGFGYQPGTSGAMQNLVSDLSGDTSGIIGYSNGKLIGTPDRRYATVYEDGSWEDASGIRGTIPGSISENTIQENLARNVMLDLAASGGSMPPPGSSFDQTVTAVRSRTDDAITFNIYADRETNIPALKEAVREALDTERRRHGRQIAGAGIQ